MKKLLACLFLFTFAIPCFIAEALAAPTERFAFDDIGLSVSIPTDFYVLTHDTPEDDPAYEFWNDLELGEDEYLRFYDEDLTFYANIYAYDNYGSDDLNTYTEDELIAFANDQVKFIEEYGDTVVDYGFYNHSQTKFLTTYSYNDEYFFSDTLEYTTDYNGLTLYFTLFSAGEIPGEIKTLMRTMVDSMIFGERTAVPGQHETPDDGSLIPEDWSYPEELGGGSVDFMAGLIFVLLGTPFAILPIVLYRFAGKKQPVPKRNALAISFSYGIVLAAVLFLFSGNYPILISAAVIWSIINYFLLITGQKASEKAEFASPSPYTGYIYNSTEGYRDPYKELEDMQNQAQQQKRKAPRCQRCGTVLEPYSTFCDKCGATVTKMNERKQP